MSNSALENSEKLIAKLTSANEKTVPSFNWNWSLKKVTIGRNQECSLVIQDKRCSKIHCEITLEATEYEPQFKVTDKSSNGTYLNRNLVNLT